MFTYICTSSIHWLIKTNVKFSLTDHELRKGLWDILAEGTITSVACERCSNVSPAGTLNFGSSAQREASSRVFVISAKIDKDFPIPISSARIPPPVSG